MPDSEFKCHSINSEWLMESYPCRMILSLNIICGRILVKVNSSPPASLILITPNPEMEEILNQLNKIIPQYVGVGGGKQDLPAPIILLLVYLYLRLGNKILIFKFFQEINLLHLNY